MQTRVVSIIGFPHSGSTLLGDILASSGSGLHIGELGVIFRVADRPCSCGATYRECPLWGPALRDVLANARCSFADLASETQAVVRRRGAGVSRRLVDAYATLLDAAGRHGGSKTVIDSSNWPGFGALLQEARPDPIQYIHLVRDPRAAVHSRIRKGVTRRLQGASDARVTVVIAADAIRWLAWNRGARKLCRRGRSVVIRYEDLCATPASELTRVASAVGIDPPRVDGRAVFRSREHVIWGNRRAPAGETVLREDGAWRSTSPLMRQRLVWALSWPERQRYGYTWDA